MTVYTCIGCLMLMRPQTTLCVLRDFCLFGCALFSLSSTSLRIAQVAGWANVGQNAGKRGKALGGRAETPDRWTFTGA